MVGWAALLSHHWECGCQETGKGSATAPSCPASSTNPQGGTGNAEFLIHTPASWKPCWGSRLPTWDQTTGHTRWPFTSPGWIWTGVSGVRCCACVGFPIRFAHLVSLCHAIDSFSPGTFLHPPSPSYTWSSAVHFLFTGRCYSSITGLYLMQAEWGTAGDKWLFGLFACCLDILFACLSPEKNRFPVPPEAGLC